MTSKKIRFQLVMIRGHDAYPGIIQRNFTVAGLGHLKE